MPNPQPKANKAPEPLDFVALAQMFHDLAEKHRGSPDAARFARLARQMQEIADMPKEKAKATV